MIFSKIKFNRKAFVVSFFIFIFFVFFLNCQTKRENSFKVSDEIPPVILWAWERPEDLRFLDAKKFGAAFLAQTLFLEKDEVMTKARRQPFRVAPDAYVIAVTRIETNKQIDKRPILSDEQKKKIVNSVKRTLELPNVKAVQIDFDAVVSERDFYQNALARLRSELPQNTPLTITALASWCVADDWLKDLPVDEAVPMIFDMGADTEKIAKFLSESNDWREPLCRKSYGISINETIKSDFKKNRRFYIFNARPWRAEDLNRLPAEIKP